jgi:hypothetical protein
MVGRSEQNAVRDDLLAKVRNKLEIIIDKNRNGRVGGEPVDIANAVRNHRFLRAPEAKRGKSCRSRAHALQSALRLPGGRRLSVIRKVAAVSGRA